MKCLFVLIVEKDDSLFMKTIDVNLVFIKTTLKVNSMKHVCHCYDGFVREYKYIQRPYIDPEEARVYYGQLDDIVLCQLSKNLDGWFYILMSNKLTDSSTIPDSVGVGYGFTTRQLCFQFVINLCQVQRGNYKTMVNSFENNKFLYEKFQEDTMTPDLWPVWKEKYLRFN